MGIKTLIEDPDGGGISRIITKPDLDAGLMVYTDSARTTARFARNFTEILTGSSSLAVDGRFSGTPEHIHNGTDNVYWTATALSGNWTFDSTNQANSGTMSVDARSTVHNDEAQFEAASSITANDYVAIAGAVYVNSWPSGGTKEVEIEARLAGVLVGNLVGLSNYIDTGNQNTWQSFSIPIADMGLAADEVDQIVVRTIDIGTGLPPNYHLDDMAWQQQGGATYRLKPKQGEIMYMQGISYTLSGPYDSTLNNSALPNIKYNQLLGLSALTNGIRINTIAEGQEVFTLLVKQHIDLIGSPYLTMYSGGDDTNAWIKYDFQFPVNSEVKLDSRNEDSLTIALADDLSSLHTFEVQARGYVEDISLSRNK